MADEKIIDLSGIPSQVSTDIYEVSSNGLGSHKETRAQMLEYMTKFNLLAPEIFISNAGNDANTGAVTAPVLTLSHAEIVLPSTIIFTADSFPLLSTYSTYPIPWVGQGPDVTTLNFGTLSLNGAIWFATTAPQKIIKDISIATSSSITFTPSLGISANSSYIFDNFIHLGASTINLSLATNAIFKNSITANNLNITDVANIQIQPGGVYTAITITVSDGTSVPDSFATLSNITCGTINIVVDPNASPGNISVTLQNISGLTNLNVSDDSSFGLIQFVRMDMATASLNPTLGGSAIGSFLPQVIGNLSVSPNLDQGFGLNSSSMSYGGTSGSKAYTFQFGNNGNVVSTCAKSAIFGRASSTHDEVFMWADSNGSVLAAPAARTGNVRTSGGFNLTSPRFQVSGSILSGLISCEVALVSTPYNISGVLQANDIVAGIVEANIVAPITLQLPTFTNFEASLAAILGVATVPLNTYKQFSVENTGTPGTVSITPNTNFVIATQNGTPTVAALSCTSFKALKISLTQYALYGV